MKNLVERVRMMRLAEGLSAVEFTQEVGINYATYVKFEQGVSSELPIIDLLKIANHRRFEKYSLWLLTNRTAPSAGQVTPWPDTCNDQMHDSEINHASTLTREPSPHTIRRTADADENLPRHPAAG